MERPSSGSAYYRVVGIDPGGDTIGFSVLSYHIETQKCQLTYAHTFTASKVVRRYPHLLETHSDRFARFLVIQEQFKNILHRYHPQAVACESPYLGRFPQAFLSLTECMHTLRLTCYDYDPCMVFNAIDPKSVKKAVGVSKKGKNKGLVAEGVNDLGLINTTGKPILSYDEHTTDAIAVAWWRLSQTLDEG